MYLHVVRTTERAVEYGPLCWVPRQVALRDGRGMCFGLSTIEYAQERATTVGDFDHVYFTFTPKPRKNIKQDFTAGQKPIVEATNVQFSFCRRCDSIQKKKKKFVYRVRLNHRPWSLLQEAFRLEGPPCGETRCRALQVLKHPDELKE